MSLVIKAPEASSVRAFRGDSPEQRVAAGPGVDPQESHLATLVRENEDLLQRLRDAERVLEGVAASAREEGRREGLSAAARDEAARISAIREALATALGAWHDRIAQLDALAVLLSKAALEKMFAQTERNAELVASTIARQAERLRGDTGVVVRVSQDDFPDEAGLAELLDRDDGNKLPIVVCADLGSGECRIDLRLGHIDVSPGEQWKRLAALLDEISDEEGAR